MESGFGPEARPPRRDRAGARLLALLALSGALVVGAVALWLAHGSRIVPFDVAPKADATTRDESGDRAPSATSIDGVDRTAESDLASPRRAGLPTRASRPADGDVDEVDDAPVFALWKVRTVARGSRSPVPHVAVSGLFSRRWPGLASSLGSTTTDEDGYAFLQVEPRERLRVHVVPTSAAFLPCEVDLEPLAEHDTRERVVELDAAKPTAVFVRVVAHSGGGPIAGASVALRVDERTRTFVAETLSAITDEHGVAEVPLLVAPAEPVDVGAPGFQTRTVHLHRGLHERADRPLVVELARTARLFGSVTDARSRPVDGADVLVTWEGGHRLGAELDDFGRFELDGLPPDVVLHVSGRVPDSREAVETTVTLADGEQRALDLCVPDVVALRGRVLLPDGSPCDDAVVKLIRPRPSDLTLKPVFVEDDGTFELGELWPGDWWVVARGAAKSMAASALVRADARAASRDGAVLVELRLALLATVQGHVVFPSDAANAPTGRASVELDQPFASPRSTRTDEHDAFAFTDVVPGPVDLSLQTLDLAESRPEWSFPSLPQGDVELRLGARPETVVWFGDCADGGSSAPQLVARRRDSDEEATARGDALRVSGWSRRAELRLAAGTWDFTATDGVNGVAVATATLAAGAGQRLTAQLEPGAWVTIHVAKPVAAAGRAVDVTPGRVLVRCGETVVDRLPLGPDECADVLVPAGKVLVELLRGGRVVDRVERTLVAGTATDVELRCGE